MTLQQHLESILELYPINGEQVGKQKLQESEIGQHFLAAIALIHDAPRIKDHVELELTFGHPSRWGFWPWISLLSRRETNTTQYGTYLVYLFHAAGDRVYLALAQGTSFASKAAYDQSLENQKLKDSASQVPIPSFTIQEVSVRADEYAAGLPTTEALLEQGWVVRSAMDLGVPAGKQTPAAIGARATGRQYEASTVLAKRYERNAVPPDDELYADLGAALELYGAFIDAGISHTGDPLLSKKTKGKETSVLLDDVKAAYTERSLVYTDEQIATFLTALATKGFVILSGLSGSGKTRIAQVLGELVRDPAASNAALFVSVRPDWRDSKPLLGYRHPLLPTKDAYQTTDFVELLRAALQNYASADPVPWIVILDEMNLARVEYYFADLLSVLESERDSSGLTKAVVRADEPLQLPPNLYVIGTVNVDETTHAFSPKVLDRAFSLELHHIDFSEYPPASETPMAPPSSTALRSQLIDFLQRDGVWARVTKEEVKAAVTEFPFIRPRLSSLEKVLEPHLMQFGYRVFDEIAVFTGLAASSGLFGSAEAGAHAAFDSGVLMKVLPKFYGSRQRLEDPLMAVQGWAVNPDDPEVGIKTLIEGSDVVPQYPRLYARAERMLRDLRRDGFASFG